MAIYMLSAKIIGRSTGGNAVAAAAYRSAEKLHDGEKTHDYTRKKAVVDSFIIAPKGAGEWATDREQLWLAVEQKENRKDSQLAREIIVSLPRELSLKAGAEVVKEFVTSELVSRGMVADVSIHNPMAGDGKSNPHAHIMLTMRELDGEEFGKKCREWNAAFGNTKGKGKQGGVTASDGLQSLRERWAVSVNNALDEADSNTRVDHRSLKDQGLNLEPQKKIGIHGKGRGGWQHQHITNLNEGIKDRNEVRAYLTPRSGSSNRRTAGAKRASWVADAEMMQAFYDSERNHNIQDIGGGYER